MSLSRQINLNIFSQLGGRGFSLIFSALATLFLRRLWGRAGFGDYVFVFAVVNLLVTLSDFGTHLVTVKETAQKEKQRSKIIGTTLTLQFFLALFTTALGFLVLRCFFVHQPVYFLAIIALPLVMLIAFKRSLLTVFHSELKLYFSSLQDILTSAGLLLAALYVFLIRGQVAFFLGLTMAVYFVTNIIFGVLAWRKFRPQLNFDWRRSKRILSQSLPLGLLLVLYTIYSKIDTLVLQYFWGSSTVGIYGLTYKVYENLVLPAAYFMNAVLPALVKNLVVDNKLKVQALWQKAASLLGTASLAGGVIIYLTTPYFIKILTGSFAEPEILALRLLLLALPFAYLNHLTGYMLIALGEQKKSLIISIGALSFNFFLNLIFVPKFSFQAAAVTTALTELLVLLLSFKVIAKKTKLSFNINLWPQTAWQFMKSRGRIFDDN